MDRYVERKGFHESLQKVTGSCTSDPFTGTDSLNKIQPLPNYTTKRGAALGGAFSLSSRGTNPCSGINPRGSN